ncbi:P-loop containing nucleoside triphosphate hydrolase [Arabidopsis thaliana x Arabidopsis arenosa]|uniref:P-loop containing nucleoside triphosphate hydrolase n=1 Tax=Arabidopsis thaliana x Arabidopsis arenosa TaxID=1240361 RepID=A0A8T1XMJ6_9BRAS|nr:P-loop containing nucleoside triphosphate hydrolase [Arabidopsis thaliana x Arabidopsis arenosa]
MDKNEETKPPDNIIYNKNDSSVSSFISHLITAFNCRGIKLFSGICLVIFSRDYASSVSCLENLAKHLELSFCDKKSYEVVPVFYGVSRSDVRQQSGPFSDAFTELERSYPADKVTRLRWALAKIAELKGHEYDEEFCEESEVVEEISEAIFEILNPTEEIGIHSRQLDIENLLCKQPWGIRTIGIFGKPGIGKTILARAVFRRMGGGYDATYFVKDFHTKHSEKGLEPLPSDFLCLIPMEEFDLNNSGSEPCHRRKRVLVVLDDVQNAQDAMSFLGAVDQFAPGSLIIITSRDKSVLEQCQMNEIYELKGLSDEDALKLLTRCAFGSGVIEQNLLDLSMRVIESSDGNPSTLISYAEELKGKKMAEMESALLKICHDAQDHQTRFEGPVHIIDVCINTLKNPSFCLISYGNDYEHAVLDKRDTNQKESIMRASHIYLSDAQNLPEFDHKSCVPESVPSDLRDSCMDHDHAVQSLPQHFHRKPPVIYQGFACQFHKLKLWGFGGYYKSFSMLKRIKLGHLVTLVEVEEISEACHLEKIDLQDCTSLESIPSTDKLERLQVLNLSGCNGIKRFPDVVRTIRELNLEGTGIKEIRSETTQYSKLVKQQSTTTTLELTQSF